MAGAHYRHGGGAANYLCMSETVTDPAFANTRNDNHGLLYGVEYEFTAYPGLRHLHDYDALCSVCTSDGPTVMVPGTANCPAGWDRQYAGFLATAHHGHPRAEALCLDEQPEGYPGSGAGHDGALLYPAEVHCGAFRCSPTTYRQDVELSCSVCSKPEYGAVFTRWGTSSCPAHIGRARARLSRRKRKGFWPISVTPPLAFSRPLGLQDIIFGPFVKR
eukprot:TRINITY_DN17963_c0_g1_i1.p1 TRINITY_DN17963_c0_g1~~TRINITY_DN17963_c0_g1_i1.p1  ORF type:complete len:218 (+),score=8.58 TRINITY_DN17963_c0_g1_i1:690-1343(+)